MIGSLSSQMIIGIKGAGEMATGIACSLHYANVKNIFMLETEQPLAVRRQVAFCEAICDQRQVVEGIEAIRASSIEEIEDAWLVGRIPVIVDPAWRVIERFRPDVVIDAIIAKKNMGTSKDEAGLVVALGPGFEAGVDVDVVIETNRGHNLGRIIRSGFAEPNTGVPGTIGGQGIKRVIRAPANGILETGHHIGDRVRCGECIGRVGGKDVAVQLDGVLRGLIRPGTVVRKGLKIGDIDPRGQTEYCSKISDKARSIGGAVLTAILGEFNKCPELYQQRHLVCAMAE